jgi:hypothetical protein
MAEYQPIMGAEIVDADGNVVVPNPGQPATGRRKYDEDGAQIKSKTRANTMNYLLRAPRGLWIAFKRKAENNGLTIRQALLLLVEDWVKGRIEIQDLATRKKP